MRILVQVLGVIAAGAIIVLMLTTVTDVIARSITNSTVPGMIEIAETALVVAVFFGLAWTAMQGGHVSVSLLTDRLGRRSGYIVAVAMWLLTSACLAWFTYATVARAIESTRLKEARFGLIQWPMYPLRWVIALGFALWLLVALTNLTRVLRRQHPYEADEEGASERD